MNEGASDEDLDVYFDNNVPILRGRPTAVFDLYRPSTREDLGSVKISIDGYNHPITGGNFVAHPHGDGVEYRVRITESEHELVAGIGDFDVISEQYYLHVDPAVHVLAVTTFPTRDWYHSPNGRVDMPVVWTKRWGLGRVYYNSLGHKVNVIDHGQPLEMLRRGLIWASHGREAAMAAGENHLDLAAPGNHY